MMSLGVVLLTTLNAGSSPILVSAFLFVMGLGLGSLMPATTLAVQSAVERGMPDPPAHQGRAPALDR